MSVRRVTYLYCDECGPDVGPFNVGPLPIETADKQRAAAKLQGWRRIDGKDVCGECARWNHAILITASTRTDRRTHE